MVDVRITLRNMPDYKQPLLRADLEHLRYGLRAELLDTFDRFRNDRGFWFKTLGIIRRFSGAADAQLQTFESVLAVLKEYELLTYTIDMADSANVVAIVKLDETYFALLQSSLPLIGKSFGKAAFMDMLRKSCKDYTKDFLVEEVV